MEDETKRQRRGRIQHYRLALEHDPVRSRERLEFAGKQLAQRGAVPVVLVQEIVGPGDRHQARLDAQEGLLRIRRHAQRLRDDRLDHRKAVLHAVIHFA
ncbi:MAG: hypothetical protein WDM84_02235 [Bauldia sp.]